MNHLFVLFCVAFISSWVLTTDFVYIRNMFRNSYLPYSMPSVHCVENKICFVAAERLSLTFRNYNLSTCLASLF